MNFLIIVDHLFDKLYKYLCFLFKNRWNLWKTWFFEKFKKNLYYVSRSFERHGFKIVCFFKFVLLVSIHDIGGFDFWLLFCSPDSSFGPTHVVVVNVILTDKNVWGTERPSSSRVYYFVCFAKRLESVCPVFVKTSDVQRDERQGFSEARTRKTSPVSRSVHHPPPPPSHKVLVIDQTQTAE